MKQKKTMIALLGISLAGVCIASFACGQAAQPGNDGHVQSTASRQPASGNKGFAVVELFTSEGCSSCPPADRLIQKIQEQHAQQPVYLLALHVDYWDHQGWKDRFSAPEFTARQKQYASWLHLETIYTPQAVVNGATEFVGSNEKAMTKAIANELDHEAEQTLTLNGVVEENKLRVEYKVTGNANEFELVLMLVQKTATSRVKAGENAGRNLAHVQVVRQMIRQDIKNNGVVSFKPAGDFNRESWELVGLVQRRTDGRITAAGKINFY